MPIPQECVRVNFMPAPLWKDLKPLFGTKQDDLSGVALSIIVDPEGIERFSAGADPTEGIARLVLSVPKAIEFVEGVRNRRSDQKYDVGNSVDWADVSVDLQDVPTIQKLTDEQRESLFVPLPNGKRPPNYHFKPVPLPIKEKALNAEPTHEKSPQELWYIVFNCQQNHAPISMIIPVETEPTKISQSLIESNDVSPWIRTQIARGLNPFATVMPFIPIEVASALGIQEGKGTGFENYLVGMPIDKALRILTEMATASLNSILNIHPHNSRWKESINRFIEDPSHPLDISTFLALDLEIKCLMAKLRAQRMNSRFAQNHMATIYRNAPTYISKFKPTLTIEDALSSAHLPSNMKNNIPSGSKIAWIQFNNESIVLPFVNCEPQFLPPDSGEQHQYTANEIRGLMFLREAFRLGNPYLRTCVGMVIE